MNNATAVAPRPTASVARAPVQEAHEHVPAEPIGAEDEERAVRVRLAVVPDLAAERRQRYAIDRQPVEELLIGSVPGQRRGDRRADGRQQQQDHQKHRRHDRGFVGEHATQEPGAEADVQRRVEHHRFGDRRRLVSQDTHRVVANSSGKWQARTVPIRRRAQRRHLIVTAPARARGQRGWNGQPVGGDSGLGGSPVSGARFARASAVGSGSGPRPAAPAV